MAQQKDFRGSVIASLDGDVQRIGRILVRRASAFTEIWIIRLPGQPIKLLENWEKGIVHREIRS
jgi:hypothetical protein